MALVYDDNLRSPQEETPLQNAVQVTGLVAHFFFGNWIIGLRSMSGLVDFKASFISKLGFPLYTYGWFDSSLFERFIPKKLSVSQSLERSLGKILKINK